MTGIKERRWAREDQDTSDLAYEASKKLLQMQFRTVRYRYDYRSYSYGDMPFPSVANILQDKLETGKIPTMDQLAACSGFMYSMITANNIYNQEIIIIS